MPPKVLGELFKAMPKQHDPRLLVGYATGDDGAVFQVSDDFAMVQTVDFFTPIVDDPRDFGAISAANSLSDIYAMGGEPLTALGLVCFPYKKLPVSLLVEINAGGAEKMAEASTLVVGGHSVDDEVIKFGYSVSGRVSPKGFWRNNTPATGDALVLTKPLGTGLLTTAVKQKHLPESQLHQPIASMKLLNKKAAEIAKAFEIHAATDVTGFGLLGHLFEMLRDQNLGATIEVDSLPFFPGVWDAIAANSITAAHKTNLSYIQAFGIEENAPSHKYMPLLLDPQTSGGLLFSLPRDQASQLVEKLIDRGHQAAIIGHVQPTPGFVCR